MTTVTKDNGYFEDQTGKSARTADGKAPTPGAKVEIGDKNGGHETGTFSGGNFVADKK